MPIYEYQCLGCDRRLETLQGISEPPLTTCPECAGELKKLFSAPAFHFKGEGWYVTDYARKGSGKGEKSEEASKAGGESKEGGAAAKAKKDGGKDEGKTETKAAGSAAG